MAHWSLDCLKQAALVGHQLAGYQPLHCLQWPGCQAGGWHRLDDEHWGNMGQRQMAEANQVADSNSVREALSK